MEFDLNCEYFTLNNYKTKAYVFHIYDGDTIHIIFKFKDTYYKWKCRLDGIDTPELKTKNEDEKKLGYEVKDILVEKIKDKIIDVECGEFDKYGRLLIKVFYENECINDWLIDNGYAKKYDGGHKDEWF